MSKQTNQVDVLINDLTPSWHDAASASRVVAWDIETSGLDWATERIGTCQLAVGDRVAVIILRDDGVPPPRLLELLENVEVTKVFHHAPFDLRFLVHHWSARPGNIACTKVLSKILDPQLPSKNHSLMPTLERHLGVRISKEQQVSDWLAPNLSDDQLAYAAADVAHLSTLYTALMDQATIEGLHPLVAASFEYLPVRVTLDLVGSGDVFAY